MGLYAVLRAIRSSSCLSWTQLCGFTYDTIPRMGSRNYGPQTSETEPALLPAFGVDDVRLQNSGSQPWVILPPRGYVATYRDIFFFLLYFSLQYCIGFAIHWHESTTCVYMSSQSWTPLPPPPHIISLDHPCAPAPSILYPVSNIDWQFVSYLIVYMFQCHSPKSSHPLPLPQSPKVLSIHLCLFCCLAYRVIITIFLNSIYMC